LKPECDRSAVQIGIGERRATVRPSAPRLCGAGNGQAI